MIATANTQPNVCFGSLADMAPPLPNVRFTAESGHHRELLTNPISTGSRSEFYLLLSRREHFISAFDYIADLATKP